jgi:hypothetical protein
VVRRARHDRWNGCQQEQPASMTAVTRHVHAAGCCTRAATPIVAMVSQMPDRFSAPAG